MAIVLPIPYIEKRENSEENALYVDVRDLKKEEYLAKAKEYSLDEEHPLVYLQVRRKTSVLRPLHPHPSSPLMMQLSLGTEAHAFLPNAGPSKAKISKGSEPKKKKSSEVGPSFIDYLYELLRKYNLTDVECYTSSNLDRRLFAKFRKEGYMPNKMTIFALIIGCRFNLEEAKKLLEIAGYAFSPSLRLDIFVKQRVISQDYSNVHEVNLALFNLGLPPLGSIVR